MVLLELSIVPLGKGESVSEYVARSLRIIDKSGLDYRLGPMGTTIEGELVEVLGVLRSCLEAMAAESTCFHSRIVAPENISKWIGTASTCEAVTRAGTAVVKALVGQGVPTMKFEPSSTK